MKVIVYRGYELTDFYELTLDHFNLTKNYEFKMDKNREDFVEALEEEYPFKIVECTELELNVFKNFLDVAYDIFGLDEVVMDEIIVKLYQFDNSYILPYEEAAKERYRDYKDTLDKLESIKSDLKLYGDIYYEKYHMNLWEELED